MLRDSVRLQLRSPASCLIHKERMRVHVKGKEKDTEKKTKEKEKEKEKTTMLKRVVTFRCPPSHDDERRRVFLRNTQMPAALLEP